MTLQNPDNKVAEDMFMKIAKAYEALTDQQVRMRATRRKLYPSITVSFIPSCKLAALLLLGQDRSKRSMKIVTYMAECIDRSPRYSLSEHGGDVDCQLDTCVWLFTAPC